MSTQLVNPHHLQLLAAGQQVLRLLFKKKPSLSDTHRMAAFDPTLYRVAKGVVDNKALCGSLHMSSDNEEEFGPLFAQDAYHFADMVYAVRNPLFNIPHCMSVGRFKYLLDTIISSTGTAELSLLDPCGRHTMEERIGVLSKLSPETLKPLSGLLVVSLANTAQQLSDITLATQQRNTMIDQFLSFSIDGLDFSICHRAYTITAVTSTDDRVNLLRVKASESKNIPVRTMLLLTEICFPLEFIPGISSKRDLYSYAQESDNVSYSFT